MWHIKLKWIYLGLWCTWRAWCKGPWSSWIQVVGKFFEGFWEDTWWNLRRFTFIFFFGLAFWFLPGFHQEAEIWQGLFVLFMTPLAVLVLSPAWARPSQWLIFSDAISSCALCTCSAVAAWAVCKIHRNIRILQMEHKTETPWLAFLKQHASFFQASLSPQSYLFHSEGFLVLLAAGLLVSICTCSTRVLVFASSKRAEERERFLHCLWAHGGTEKGKPWPWVFWKATFFEIIF